MRARELLLRLALAPQGVVLDSRHRVGGRGAWVCADEACARRAARALARALRLPPLEVAPDDLRRLVTRESSVLGGETVKEG